MNPLVVIPARGGSKGIPRKNIKVLNGKPLIVHTIDAARKVFEDHTILVSTDDLEIKNVAENTGLKVPFLRPEELATDTAGSREVLLHALSHFEEQGNSPDVIVLLQPTSPFRNAEQIKESLKLWEPGLDMVVSVKATESNPYYNLFEENEMGYLERSKKSEYTRRQDCPEVYEYNGAIYLINPKSLKAKPFASFSKIKKYAMDAMSSHDIDTELDWLIAEQIAKRTTND